MCLLLWPGSGACINLSGDARNAQAMAGALQQGEYPELGNGEVQRPGEGHVTQGNGPRHDGPGYESAPPQPAWQPLPRPPPTGEPSV